MPALSPRIFWLLAILVALLHAFMAVTAVNTKSPTFDEPQHLAAGYSFWATNDYRLDPENGNLPARWAALPLLLGDTKFVPSNHPTWQYGDEGRTAHQFLYELGNDADRVIADGRMMMSIFGIALCLLIYRIAREFFGVLGGLLAETVAAFDPNFLAHSALVTSDVAAAFFFTATVWSSWRVAQKISATRLVIAALTLSGLFLTKFSAPIVLPVVGLMSILQIFSRRGSALRFGRFRIAFTDKRKKAVAISASWLVLGVTVFFAIWLSFSFRYSAWLDDSTKHEGTSWHWSYLLENRGAFEKTIEFCGEHHLLPEAYLYGLAYVHKHEVDRPAFLDNQWSVAGFRSFFPLAFLYKTPLPLVGVLALAAFALIRNRQRWKLHALFNPLFAFALFYAALAITSQLNIGHRHLLPIYPALFVACGAAVILLRDNLRPIVAAALMILLIREVGESLAIRPNYLAYFNQIAGGPARGYQHLVESSLDWGQDLPGLKTWIDNHKSSVEGKPLFLAYFGSADSRYYGIEAKTVSDNPLSQTRLFVRLSGGIYCVSATTLQSVYTDAIGPWCVAYEQAYQNALAASRTPHDLELTSGRVSLIANENAIPFAENGKALEQLQVARLCAYLRHHTPLAQIGYSIFVFDLNQDEIEQALYARPPELVPEPRVHGL